MFDQKPRMSRAQQAVSTVTSWFWTDKVRFRVDFGRCLLWWALISWNTSLCSFDSYLKDVFWNVNEDLPMLLSTSTKTERRICGHHCQCLHTCTVRFWICTAVSSSEIHSCTSGVHFCSAAMNTFMKVCMVWSYMSWVEREPSNFGQCIWVFKGTWILQRKNIYKNVVLVFLRDNHWNTLYS